MLLLYPQDGKGGDQWGIAGDTFVVGCRLPDSLVFPGFNPLNPDMQNPEYNTESGVYEPNCGMHNLLYAFGHDEYMYMVSGKFLFLVSISFNLMLARFNDNFEVVILLLGRIFGPFSYSGWPR
jgi:hypothetical protein